MCYSAQIQADYRAYTRLYGAEVSLADFHRLYWQRNQGLRLKIPRGIDAAFAQPRNAAERAIKALIDAYDAAETTRLEQEVFKQKKRLADAERRLARKPTKAAAESRRIASEKIAWALGKLADLRRSEPAARDARIFPGWYAPVMVMERGRRIVRPMRYQCRPAGKPASFDVRFPGTYNARRDNLEGFWREQFGHCRALLCIQAFYENVSRHAMEHRPLAPGEADENVVLEFRPRPAHDMLVACLWSALAARRRDAGLLCRHHRCPSGRHRRRRPRPLHRADQGCAHGRVAGSRFPSAPCPPGHPRRPRADALRPPPRGLAAR